MLAVGYALYLRYRVIEPSIVGLACQAGTNSWFCFARQIAIALFTNSVFGWTALAASVLNFMRPTPILFGLGLIAAGFGIVLYNVGLSALAVGLVDPQPRASRARSRMTASIISAPHSQTACQFARPSL